MAISHSNDVLGLVNDQILAAEWAVKNAIEKRDNMVRIWDMVKSLPTADLELLHELLHINFDLDTNEF